MVYSLNADKLKGLRLSEPCETGAVCGSGPMIDHVVIADEQSWVRSMMKATVTCEVCKHKQRTARDFTKPESFYLVCHECESVLKIEVTDKDLKSNKPGFDWKNFIQS